MCGVTGLQKTLCRTGPGPEPPHPPGGTGCVSSPIRSPSFCPGFQAGLSPLFGFENSSPSLPISDKQTPPEAARIAVWKPFPCLPHFFCGMLIAISGFATPVLACSQIATHHRLQ
jgi:hypothetical protein